jgi:hypothetical protein
LYLIVFGTETIGLYDAYQKLDAIRDFRQLVCDSADYFPVPVFNLGNIGKKGVLFSAVPTSTDAFELVLVRQ